MNVTLSIDDRLLEKARSYAAGRGLSLNQMIRAYLESVTTESDAQADIREMLELSRRSPGDSRGWKFNRDEVHERS